MVTVDPNTIASAGINDLQDAIDKLTAMKTQNGADIVALDAQIEALEEKQADLRNQALRAVEDSAANQAAIAAMKTAATNLTSEAAKIKDLASALQTAAAVVNAAVSLITALKPFI